METKKAIFVIAGIDVVVGSMPMLFVIFDAYTPALFPLAALIISVVTLFGFLAHNLNSGLESITANVLRTAITMTIVVLYLYIVSVTSFFQSWDEKMPQITQTMISNFTTIVGVVIAFYFTSTAIVDRGKKTEPPSDQQGGSKRLV